MPTLSWALSDTKDFEDNPLKTFGETFWEVSQSAAPLHRGAFRLRILLMT